MSKRRFIPQFLRGTEKPSRQGSRGNRADQVTWENYGLLLGMLGLPALLILIYVLGILYTRSYG